MKTCNDCVFLSNRRPTGTAHVCLIVGRYTARKAPACTHFDRPSNSPSRIVALGEMLRELGETEVKV